jgi:type I restriction enzyme S subunit
LGAIAARLQYGTSSLAHSEPIGLPVLRMNNLQDDGWDLTDLKYINLTPKEAELYRLNSGDILFNRTNSKELVGKCQVFRESGHWVFASYLIRVSIDESKALPDFVSRFLNTSAGRAQIDRVSRQIVGMSNINAEEIRELQIPLPSLEVQRALVTELEAARISQQKKLAQADERLEGIDDYLLDQLGLTSPTKHKRPVFAVQLSQIKNTRIDVENMQEQINLKATLSEDKYPNLMLKQVAQIIMGQAPEGKDYNDVGIGLPLLAGAADLGDDVPSPKKYTSSAPKKCLPNDIILCVRATIGKLNWADREYCLGRGVAGIRPNLSLISANYLYEVLYLRRFYFLSKGTGSTFKQIITKEVEACPIPLPPIKIQQSIAEEAMNRRKEAQHLREEAAIEWAAAKARFERKLLGEEA